MAELPLVEGKSVYAEMVCPPLIMEYRRVLEEYGGRWPVAGSAGAGAGGGNNSNSGLTQEDVSLNVIRKFVENCSKRHKYERALLEERNVLLKSTTRSSSSNSNMATANDNATATANTATNTSHGDNHGGFQQHWLARFRGNNRHDTAASNSLDQENIPEENKNSNRVRSNPQSIVVKLGTMSIPSPGVPEDIVVNVDEEVWSLVSNVDVDNYGDHDAKK